MPDFNRFRIPGLERKFTRGPRNKAILVVLQVRERENDFIQESSEELKELSRSAQIQILEVITGRVPHPSPRHFVREGKLAEIQSGIERHGANLVIFNVELSATQVANIESFVGIPVIDRTALILEIFSQRAQSREGKLQVELAQLSYTLPRIGGLGGVMSRLGGGVGTRGPGEQELEKDKRKIRLRIQQVKGELEKVRKHRQLIRSSRKRKRFITIALVGYTNAGKSTLLNALTGAQSWVADKMFATLDPVARVESINGHNNILFIDTVGFLRDLPHTLVEAFHATLEEVTQADLLIHVLDVSDPHAAEYKEAVEKVLTEIHARDKTTLLVLNKADLLNENEKDRISNEWPEGILISAKEKLGMQGLLARLEDLTSSPNRGADKISPAN